MKRTLFSLIMLSVVLAPCVAKGNKAEKTKKGFEPLAVENLEPRPDFWKVRPQEIIDLCESVRKGHSEKIAVTPLGFPVYAVFYGDFSEPEPQTNFSAGNSSSTIMSYLGDRYSDPDAKQTIMYLTGVHGSEPEGVAAAVNMIQMLETGRDFRGHTDPELLELASRYRLIIIPCLNMDGRSICPDHLRGQPYEVFRKACQGTWKDGSLIGWLGSKEHYPLPLDKVSFPGGYPNGDGYNIQHDCTPGDMKTEEAKAVCRLMSRWRVDLLLNVHSCEISSTMFEPGLIDTPEHIKRGNTLYTKVLTAYKEAGLRDDVPEIEGGDEAVDLTQLANYCSGALGLTVECSSSYDDIQNPTVCYTFDQLMESATLAFKVVMEDGLREPFNRRIDRTSDKTEELPAESPETDRPGFVYVTDVIPDAILEIRYYSTYNFIGDRIPGYEAPVAMMTRQAADSLKAVNDDLKAKGYILKIYDAYRPQCAVDYFMKWAEDISDVRMKGSFYPEIEKASVVPQGYVARRSSHTRGSTVDLTLVNIKTGREVDMGCVFDYFGVASHPTVLPGQEIGAYKPINAEQYSNRMLLREAMLSHGFKPYDCEWWHFTLKNEPYPDTYFNFPLR